MGPTPNRSLWDDWVFSRNVFVHYGQMIFEVSKHFIPEWGHYIFRPQKYHERMNRSCQRLCIPEIGFDIFYGWVERAGEAWSGMGPERKGGTPSIFAHSSLPLRIFLGVKVSETTALWYHFSRRGLLQKKGSIPWNSSLRENNPCCKRRARAAKTPANYAATSYLLRKPRRKASPRFYGWMG